MIVHARIIIDIIHGTGLETGSRERIMNETNLVLRELVTVMEINGDTLWDSRNYIGRQSKLVGALMATS